MAIASRKYGVLVWDAETGEQLFDHGDTSIVNNRIVFTSDSRMIITGDWDGLIRIWGIPE